MGDSAGPSDGRGRDRELRAKIAAYLKTHHTMSLATMGQTHGVTSPHVASVFYASDKQLRLVFLSKPSSLHGTHIGDGATVAVAVAGEYADWQEIQGVQLWGRARVLGGTARAGAMAVYLRRFPFVRALLRDPRFAELVREVAVYRVEPRRIAFTDNTTGVFGRQVLDLPGSNEV